MALAVDAADRLGSGLEPLARDGLAAIPAAVTDFVARLLVRYMGILLSHVNHGVRDKFFERVHFEARLNIHTESLERTDAGDRTIH